MVQWTYTTWQANEDGTWETQPRLTINGITRTFATALDYIHHLEWLRKKGAKGDFNKYIGDFNNVVHFFKTANPPKPVRIDLVFRASLFVEKVRRTVFGVLNVFFGSLGTLALVYGIIAYIHDIDISFERTGEQSTNATIRFASGSAAHDIAGFFQHSDGFEFVLSWPAQWTSPAGSQTTITKPADTRTTQMQGDVPNLSDFLPYLEDQANSACESTCQFVSIRKTDGQAQELAGVKMYEMEAVVTVKALADFSFDTGAFTGWIVVGDPKRYIYKAQKDQFAHIGVNLNFQKYESGWKINEVIKNW